MMSGIADNRAARLAIGRDFLRLWLVDGREVRVPLSLYPTLQKATRAQRRRFELFGDGRYVHWPEIDLDVEVEQLVLGEPEGFPPPPDVARKMRRFRVREAPGLGWLAVENGSRVPAVFQSPRLAMAFARQCARYTPDLTVVVTFHDRHGRKIETRHLNRPRSLKASSTRQAS